MDDQNTKRRTVRQVVHDVVADVAPEELPILQGLSRLDDDKALRRLTRRRRPREPLGFGMDTIATLATAIVWVAVQESVKRIVGPPAEGLARRVGAWFRRLFRRPPRVPTIVPELTREQVTAIGQRVQELAEQNNLDADRATVLAKCVMKMLESAAPDTGQFGKR